MALSPAGAAIVGSNRTKRRYDAIVDVDDEDAIRMMDRVMETVGPVSLERWLRMAAHPHFTNEIVQRFAYQGDRVSGHWPDASEATEAMKENLEFDAEALNIRTGEMFDFLTSKAQFSVAGDQAMMSLPGRRPNPLMTRKIRTAQFGSNDNPIDEFGPTPPRPVLGFDEQDMEFLLRSLERWVVWGVVGSFVV